MQNYILNYMKKMYIQRMESAELYEKADSYAIKNLKGSELKYFYSTTD